MSRNERRAWIYIIFLKTFFDEGHFGESEPIREAIAGVEKAYNCQTSTKSEYDTLVRAVDRIANALRGNESNREMMIMWATDIAERYMAHTSGVRCYAWQQLFTAMAESAVYRTLIARVPTERDLSSSEFAVEISQLFDVAMTEEGVI